MNPRVKKSLKWGGVGIAVLIALIGALAGWVLFTTSGARWVAGQVTSVNGVAFVAGPAAGVGLYMVSLALPFLVTAVLMLVLAIWTWLRFSPSAPAE